MAQSGLLESQARPRVLSQAESSESQTLPGLHDVPRDLLSQGIRRLEACFLPQSPLEGEIDLDPVQIARKVDDVSLGHQNQVAPKGRSKANVRHDRQGSSGPFRIALETTQMAKIDSRGG